MSCRSILVSEVTVKKRVEQLIGDLDQVRVNEIKWQFFKDYDINEENLIKIVMEQLIPKQIRYQPNGVGFNTAFDQLNLVVAPNGRTIFIINACDVIVVDPCEHLQRLFDYYGLPISSLRAIFMTDAMNVNIFECLMKL